MVSLRGNFSACFAVDHVRVRPFAISRLTGYHAGGKSDRAPRSVLIIRKLFRGRHVGSGRIGRSELVAQLYDDRNNIELACSIGGVSQRQYTESGTLRIAYRFGRGSRVNVRLLGRLIKYRVTYNAYLDTLHQIDRNFTKTHVNLLLKLCII